MDSFTSNLPAWLTLSCAPSGSHDSCKLSPTSLTCSLSQLSQASSHPSDKLTLTNPTCSLSQLICLLQQLRHIDFYSSEMLSLTAMPCSLSPLTVWHCGQHAGSGVTGSAGSKLVVVGIVSLIAENLEALWSGTMLWIWHSSHDSDMVGLTAVTCPLSLFWQSGLAGSKLIVVYLALLVSEDLDLILAGKKRWDCLRWEQDVSSRYGFAGSMLVQVDMASLVVHNVDSLWAAKNLWIWSSSHNSHMLGFATLTY